MSESNVAKALPKHTCRGDSSHLTPLATYDECWVCHQIFNYRYRKLSNRIKALFRFTKDIVFKE